ncbi:type IV pilus twitching motility protein PilT [Lachnobacterium bovis]|uniref:Twitching motility protein PilT n=1 Tax=Lachnobacterium bovis TaxID=140626 RepID=A0A1H9TJE1_9FIRM|nr:PilT/PilU family type 4a pilus ATPase [Lachnobacterium bovis]SER97226.1 twitching motility protein PilT [Lachnobacterium bovis]
MGESSIELLLQILNEAKDNDASDIHLAPSSNVMIRVDGDMIPLEKYFLKPYDIEGILNGMLKEKQLHELEENGELDFAYSVSGLGRVRVNVFRQRGTFAMSMRILPFVIPDARSLNIPESVIDLCKVKKGLILVTGPSGSGKSTTIAALLREIAQNSIKNIITIEDPIEYLHQHGKSIVLQREIGVDTSCYSRAIKAALRQDPDVIFVGEMRDLETISSAIAAAENGRLVFSTLHNNNVVDAIDRLIEVYPVHQQQQIRVMLASVIKGVVAQQLLPIKNSKGREVAFEVMLNNMEISKLIKIGKTNQIINIMQESKKDGMRLMDDSIYDLYMKGIINGESAISYSSDKTLMSERVQLF